MNISELGSAGQTCLIKGCMRARTRRGLCLVCYSKAKKKVEAGEATWDRLAEMGLCEHDADPFDAAYDEAKRRNRAKDRETERAREED